MAGETWRDEQRATIRSDAETTAPPAATWRVDEGQIDLDTRRARESSLGSRSVLRLPSALAEQWRLVRELESRGAEADLLIIANSGGEQRVAKIYRAGIQPKTDVLQQLGTSFEHVVRLFDSGHSDGRFYEILEYVGNGSLEDLVGYEGKKLNEDRVGEILAELTGAIRFLHAHGVVHRDLKPSNILVRSREPLDLILTDFGIASTLGAASRRFTTAHRTIAYASPEAAAGEVSKASDWWSLGIMVVEMLTGRHPFASALPGELLDDRAIMSRLAQMPIDQLAEGVEEPWHTLCRGLLRRESKNRWTDTEIVRWARRDPGLAIAEETAPYANRAAQFYFAGGRYSDLKEIGGAFVEKWAEARKAIERGHLLNWVKDDLKDNEWRQFLSDLDRDCPELDERVFQIVLKLDPSAVPVFCGHELDPEGLRKLADNATSGNSEAIESLRRIFDRGILQIAAKATGIAQFQMLHDGLSAVANDFQKLGECINRAGAARFLTPSNRDFPVAAAMLALLPKAEGHVASLRAIANAQMSEDARDCPWFRELVVAAANSTAALLIIPLVAKAAEQETRDRRQQQDLTQRQRHYEEAYRAYSMASGWSVGALGGLLVGFIPCWIFTGIVGAIGGTETAWGWYTFLMLGFAVAGIVVGHNLAFEKKWMENQSYDAAQVKSKGLLLAIPSLIVIALLCVHWSSLARNDNEKAKTLARHQDIQRRASIVNYALVGTGIDHNGNLTGAATTLIGPRTPVVGFFNYRDGKIGSDSMVLTLRGSTTRSSCDPIVLRYASGNIYCTWNNVSVGSYSIDAHVNGQLVRTISFSVR